jgi:hypothetical protein
VFAIATQLVFGPLVFYGANPNVTLDIDPAFAKHGVLAVGYSHPQFQPMLLNLVGPQNALALEPLRKYTLILKSTYPAPIALVVIRYPRVSVEGHAVRGLVINTIADSTIPLADGDGLILTPEGQVNQALNHLPGKSARPYPATPAQAIQSVAANIQQAWGDRFTQGQVSLDSVVFADGGVVGPDRMGVIALLRGEELNENDLAARAQDPSMTDAQFSQWLSDVHQSPMADPEISDRASGQLQNYKITLATAARNRLKNFAGSTRAVLPDWVKSWQARKIPAPSTLHLLS